jgi:hypothetical protein
MERDSELREELRRVRGNFSLQISFHHHTQTNTLDAYCMFGNIMGRGIRISGRS